MTEHLGDLSQPAVAPQREDGRIPILYLAPWVDFGGSDKGTIDWFRWLDRDRFAPSLITTQPSGNRRLKEIQPLAEEVWALPEHLAGPQFPGFIFDFIHTRGVRLLHIMNSRLGFELLPDLASLDHPPAVVVQLHVEESDRSGYVRYVTTRYGNLVHAYSVTSQHLAQAVQGYDVPAHKIHVIPTGVDADHEFNPERVRPCRDPDPGTFRILFPGRLVEQKDPLLMVEVLGSVAARHDHVTVDVIGDGSLDLAVRARVAELGLERKVCFHPPSADLAGWFASSDLLLMTSTFEGVPYVVYEAMAMKVPVVAPALPGNVELMDDTAGCLVEPRHNVAGYVDAVCRLIEDDGLRRRLGEGGRRRVREAFSLRQMAERHETVYAGLLGPRATLPLRSTRRFAPMRFPDRSARGAPLVSVVTPCYNHGHYLRDFLDGILAQDYPAIEVILVDDASTDGTRELLSDLEHDDRVRVIYNEHNGGPASARNRAVSAASGRYILPVDADNILLPGAVRSLVDQLQAAGEQVGFIYPGFKYFGNRDYKFDAPSYNLFSLLHANYVDTCSLIDRAIFDSGLRYAEDVKLGHEDWDLVLAMAARGVIGEPSRGPVMLYRKQGFTRSDAVAYLRLPFWREIQARHPELFGTQDDVGAWGRHRGPAMHIKVRSNPAFSIIAAAPVDFTSEHGVALLDGLQQQTCGDFELLAECAQAPRREGCHVRRIPAGLARSPGERLQEALQLSRGRYLLLTSVPTEMFADQTAIEKLSRGFWNDRALSAVALADGGQAQFNFQLIDRVGPGLVAHTLAWRRELHQQLPAMLAVEQRREIDSLAKGIHGTDDQVQWRHLEAALPRGNGTGETFSVELEGRGHVSLDGQRESERLARLKIAPGIPAMPQGQVARWTPVWTPPESLPLARHIHDGSGERVVTNEREPPPGYRLEFDLGAIQRFSPPGTVRLVRRDAELRTVARGSERLPGDEELGNLEEVPLPLFVGIERAEFADGSQTLVLATERDKVRARASRLTLLGFVEGFPNEPIYMPRPSELPRPSLVRVLDEALRCHRYSTIGSVEQMVGPPAMSAELGQLAPCDAFGVIPVWIDAVGALCTDRYEPQKPAPGLRQLARWVAAPLTWRGFAHRLGRTRSFARRVGDAGRHVLLGRLGKSDCMLGPHGHTPGSRGATVSREAIGCLYCDPGLGRVELFSATHPVVRDQFLTHYPLEATDMGYGTVTSLGYIGARAPLTGTLGGGRAAVTWASRFGLMARRG